MAVQLDDIFARVGMRPRKIKNQTFIYGLPVSIIENAVGSGAGFRATVDASLRRRRC